ncbi:MAG: DedA family protein [Actinomycetota bacterium]|jgi:undecaprenyl-diphosphatase|nr:DedA family protein [Actinomycetota bacterium]MDQ3905716.1 DedA family protein [Actinomycetota bacterium]
MREDQGMVLDALRALPPTPMLILAFLFPALEASTMLGVVFPGEIAILVAGAAAQVGTLPLWAVIPTGVAGAVIGDAIGFGVGRRYGAWLLNRLPEWLVKPEAVHATNALIRRRGPLVVLIGRTTALLRALVPGLAGMSGLSWRRFLPYNLLGGMIWATVVAALGYLAGASLTLVQDQLGMASNIILAAVVTIGLVVWLRAHFRRRHAKL